MNIIGINNLPFLLPYVTKKESGYADEKRMWDIEQNEACKTYLGHYFYYSIDVGDYMIKNSTNRYIT